MNYEIMAADLTVENLGKAISHFLREIAGRPEVPVKELTLWGTPADDGMKTLMERFGGTIRINVCKMPEEMVGLELYPKAVVGDGSNLWQPSKEAV